MKVYDKNGQEGKVSAPFYRFSDMFNDFFGEKNYTANFSNPAVNISEEPDSYMLSVALPGVSKTDVSIKVEKDMLILSRNAEVDNAEVNYNRREFDYSNFNRSFKLPHTVNVSKISAKMDNGILWLILPKKEEAIDKGPKEIKIS
jgi:HSP20 family protein